MTTDQRGRLLGWKAVAAYLGKDVRTVLRWERERGLPVHRPPGRRGQSVYALPEELDRWIARPEVAPEIAPEIQVPSEAPAASGAPPARPSMPRWRWIAVPVMLLLAAAAYAAWPRPMMARVAIEGVAVRAYDGQGRELWSYPLLGDVATASTDNGIGRTSYIGDIDADGSLDAIVSVVVTRQAPDLARSLLICLDSDGRLKWSQELADAIEIRGRQYGPPWAGGDLLVYGDGQRRVVWTTHHYTWSPSITVTLDGASGARLSRYVHDGWLMRLDVTTNLRHVIAAGIAHYDRHAIAVLNANDLSEHAYFALPRPDASAAAAETLDRQYYAISQHGAPTIRFGHSRTATPTPETIVELSPDLRGSRVTQSDSYWTWHQALEREGHLSHDARKCPERAGIPLRASSR